MYNNRLMVERYVLKKLNADEANRAIGNQGKFRNRRITCVMPSGEKVEKIPFEDVFSDNIRSLEELFNNTQRAKEVINEEIGEQEISV